MSGMRKALSSQFGQAECQLLPCPGWDCGALFSSATLRVEGNWLAGNPSTTPVLLVAHLLAGGPCFFLRCPTKSGQPPRPWAELHKQLAGENRAGVLKTAGRASVEVMLVALTAQDTVSGTTEAIYAGFVASLLGGDLMQKLLLTMRLPLVFDLDETLLVAKSQSQLARELKALREHRRPALQNAVGDPQQAMKLAALDREEQLMKDDLALLQQFAEDDAVTYKGQRLHAQIEEAFGDDMSRIPRPVIRLPGNDDTLLTRIEPTNPHSSMVFKLRPNWRAIWGYLGGLMDPHTHQPVTYTPPSPKLRFEAYVCTAAERGYALEAWRVLDPDGWMIPPDQRQHRLHSGSKLKSLGSVLRLGRTPQPGPNVSTVSPMPLAVIVDDRVEIWDACNRGQVLQVEPFRPWEEQAALELGLIDTPNTQTLSAQMIRLKEELFNLRKHAFHRVQEVLRRQLDMLHQQPLSLSRPLHESYAAALVPAPWVEGLIAAGLHRVAQPEGLPPLLQAAIERPVDPRQLRRQQQQQGAAGSPAQQFQQQLPPQQQHLAPGVAGQQPPPLAQLSGQAGVELLATLQGLLDGQQPGPQPGPPTGGVPVDPRLQLMQPVPPHQQQHQQPPPEAVGQQQQQQHQAGRPQRQRPGRLPPGSQAPPEQGAPGPGVAALQRQMASDPRRRPQGGAAGQPPPADTSTLSDALGMLHTGAPPQQQQQQQPGAAGRPRPPPMRRLVGLHGPSAGQEQAPGQQRQQQQHAPEQSAGAPQTHVAGPGQQAPAGLSQQQSAWGTASAAMPAGAMLPHLVGMAPGAGQAPRPMQRVQHPPQHPPPPQQSQPPATLPPGPQRQGPAAAGDDMRQRWLETFNSMEPGQGAGQQLGQAQPHPMQRVQAAPGQQAGVKRKSTDSGDEAGGSRQKQPRRNQQQPQQQGGPPGSNGVDALAQLYTATQRQHVRLQWQCTQQPEGRWHVAAYVGGWLSDFPPPHEQPAGVGTGPTQQEAMQAAAAAALQHMNAAGGAGAPSRPPGGRAAPPPPPRHYGAPQTGPYTAAPQRAPPPTVGGVTSRNAIDTLIGHFPAATNRIEWQEQPQGSDGSWRCRLVVNGGEFEAVGTGPPGPRGDKRAKQHAALLVLQKAGYAVHFDNPSVPAAGAHGGLPGSGSFAGPGPSRGGGRGAPPGRMERRSARNLDTRHAQSVAQQQQGVTRDAYLASLQDELS